MCQLSCTHPHVILMTTFLSGHYHLYVAEVAQIQRGGGLTKDSQINFQSTKGTQSLHLIGLGVKGPGFPPWGPNSIGWLQPEKKQCRALLSPDTVPQRHC